MEKVFVVLLILCLMFTTNLGNRAMAENGEDNMGALLAKPIIAATGFDMDYLDNGYVDIQVDWSTSMPNDHKDLKLILIRDGKEENSISISSDEKTYFLRSSVTTGETYTFQVKIKGKQRLYMGHGWKYIDFETVSDEITVDYVPISVPKPVDFEVTGIEGSTASLMWKYSQYWHGNNFYEFIITNNECVIPKGVYAKGMCEEYGSTRDHHITLNNLHGVYDFRVMPIGSDGYVQEISDPINNPINKVIVDFQGMIAGEYDEVFDPFIDGEITAEEAKDMVTEKSTGIATTIRSIDENNEETELSANATLLSGRMINSSIDGFEKGDRSTEWLREYVEHQSEIIGSMVHSLVEEDVSIIDLFLN